MELIHKALDFEVRQVGDPKERTLEFIGSTADVDRYGDIIEVAGWDLKNFQKNPVILWAHNYGLPPVGTAKKVTKVDKALVFEVYFPKDDEINAAGWPDNMPTPETVYRLCLAGVLRTTSVGFQGLETEPIYGEPQGEDGWRPRTGTRYLKQDLYELSIVPVPANPYAVIQDAVRKGIIPESQARFFQAPEGSEPKGVIPFKKYPIEEDLKAKWDGPAETKAASVDDLKIMCSWFDSEKPDIKGAYKLPHHRAKDKKVIWRGLTGCMAALLGGRGGVDAPEDDRKGIYNHLAKEYAIFDKTPPEFKAYTAVELRLIELGLPPDPAEIDKLLAPTKLATIKDAADGDPCGNCPEKDDCCCPTCANNQPGACCCESCDQAATCECCPGNGACDQETECPCKASACDNCSVAETCSCNSCDQAATCHCSPCSPTTKGMVRHPHSPCDECCLAKTCSCKGCDQMASCHCSPCTSFAGKAACHSCKAGRYRGKTAPCAGKKGAGQTKSGAVLSAKNKEALKKAVGHIQGVLDAAEGSGEETGMSYYRLALTPGKEPHGARQASEPEIPEEIGEMMKEIHQTIRS
ncbi:MAG: HK97 family phage prohead protease [Desulfobaccales bacterium]